MNTHSGFIGLVMATVISTFSLTAMSATVTIDKKTPKITPTDMIHQFEEIDWDKVATRQKAGKPSGDSIVTVCDDTYIELVEIKIPEGIAADVSFESDCKLHGANTDGENSPAWIQFEAPRRNGGCTIKVKKTPAGVKTPLLVEYELADAC